eukprot:gene35684-46288_t
MTVTDYLNLARISKHTCSTSNTRKEGLERSKYPAGMAVYAWMVDYLTSWLCYPTTPRLQRPQVM